MRSNTDDYEEHNRDMPVVNWPHLVVAKVAKGSDKVLSSHKPDDWLSTTRFLYLLPYLMVTLHHDHYALTQRQRHRHGSALAGVMRSWPMERYAARADACECWVLFY